jgi:pantothenate kinase
MNSLSYAINFWSKGDMKALFLRHEGHLGATGAVSALYIYIGRFCTNLLV